MTESAHLDSYGYQAGKSPWSMEYPRDSGLTRTHQANPLVAVTDHSLYLSLSALPETECELGWGHRCTYASIVRGGGRVSPLGSGWFLSDFPFLVGKGNTIGVVESAANVSWNKWAVADAIWHSLKESLLTLRHDTVDRSFLLTNDKLQLVFNSFDESFPRTVRGQLKGLQIESRRFKLHHNSQDILSRIEWLDKDAILNELRYEYLPGAFSTAVLTAVTRFRAGAPVEHVVYTHAAFGSHKVLLQSSTAERWINGAWSPWQHVRYGYDKVMHNPRKTPLLNSLQVFQTPDDQTCQALYEIRYTHSGQVAYVVHEGLWPPVFYSSF